MQLYQDAEAFINNMFFTKTHDKRSTLDVRQIIGDKLRSDNLAKDPEYFNSTPGIVHASKLTACLRGLYHEMMGTEKDKKDAADEARKLGVFKAGNLFEDFIIDSLGDQVIERQRQYTYKYKSLTLVGRSDFTIKDGDIIRIGENKSVHSDSFWYRQKEGTLIAWQNQVQLQIYMWLERILNGNEWEGLFTYVSKDDVTVMSAPIKFNQEIIDQIVIPALDLLNEAFEKKDPLLLPIPAPVVYNNGKNQYQKNWLASYCDHHNSCAGAGWILEATDEVTRKNNELRGKVPTAHLAKKEKPVIAPTA